MRQRTSRLNQVLALVLTIVALMTGQTASAFTKTYTVSGGKGNSSADFYAQFTNGSTTSNQVSWTYNSTAEISFNLGTNLTLTLSNTDKRLFVQDNNAIGGRGATTLTVSGNNYYYIYCVRLLTAGGNVIQLDAYGNAVTQGGVSECEYWNMTKSFSQTFSNGIIFSKIEVSYDTAIPITDAVFSGLNASYPVSNAQVTPAPTVTWHGSTLTRGTHYTLSYENNATAGTATVTATGIGIFSSSKSATFTLYWATYTVRFNKNNDGASGTMSDQAFTYNTAQNLTANAFTRIGYTFSGWNTKADGSGTSYTDGQSVSNLTTNTNGAIVNLYAQWTPHHYTLRLHRNDGSNGYTDMSMTYDVAANIKSITRTGYTLDGWSTTPNGNVTYTNGQSVLNLTSVDGEVIDLYAQWTGHPYTVHFDANGGTGEMSDMAFTYGTAQNLTANAFTRTGYTFAGWSTAPSGNVRYTDGQSVSNLTTENGATVILYAKWTPITYTLRLHRNYGTDAYTDMSMTYDSPQNLTPNTFTRTGYTLDGWSTTPDGNVTYTNGQEVLNLTASSGAIVDLYAQWTFITTVKYIDGNGDEKTCTNISFIESSTGSTVTLGTDGTESWYVVNGNVNITRADGYVLEIKGAVHLILMDGATLTVESSRPIYASGSLSIYGQSLGTGSLVANGSGTAITVNEASIAVTDNGTLTVNGGNITATSTNSTAINVNNAITINGGSVTASSSGISGKGIYASGDITINGGTVNATGGSRGVGIYANGTITLGWTNLSDRIYANSYQGGNGIVVKEGQAFTDGTNTYSGTVSASDIADKTLQPSRSISTWYVDADGNTQTTNATPLTGTENTLGTNNETTWYVVSSDISFDHQVKFYGDVRLILSDGKTMTMTQTDAYKLCIDAYSLTIYGQSGGTGALTMTNENYTALGAVNLTINGGHITATAMADALGVVNLTINGGIINATAQDQFGICSYGGTITINGGVINATSQNDAGIRNDNGNIIINGGNVTATTTGSQSFGMTAGNGNITLGWTNLSDRIYASSYFNLGTVKVKSGQTFTDGTNIYSGSLTNEQIDAIAGKELQPSLSISTWYVDADGNTQTTNATPLTGTENTLGTVDETTWYVVSSDISFDHYVEFYGDVRLILSDGKTMTMTQTGNILCIRGYLNSNLTIYGQSGGTGALTMTSENYGALGAVNLTINGGQITATALYDAISANNNITINGGVINATSQNQSGIFSDRGTITINGGTVTATNSGNNSIGICAGGTITLGWTKLSDRIYASSYYSRYGIVVKEGQAFTDGTNTYSGTLTDDERNAIARKTLQPYLGNSTWYVDANGNIATVEATPLDNTMTTLEAGTYVVNSNINYTSKVTTTGDVTLILADGCTMSIEISYSNSHCLVCGGHLTIYGQTLGTGTLRVRGEECNGSRGIQMASDKNYTQYGGCIDIRMDNEEGSGIYNGNNVTLAGGTLYVFSYNYGIYSADNITISGGQLYVYGSKFGIEDCEITLGFSKPTDCIYINSCEYTIINIVEGQQLRCGNETISGNNIVINNVIDRWWVRETDADYSLTANPHDGNYWTTFYCGAVGYEIAEENACAYTATLEGSTLTLHKLGKVIPQGTAVIIVGEDNNISLKQKPSATGPAGNNDLCGVNIRTAMEWPYSDTYYVMGKQNSNFGFFQYTADYMPARKAYLPVSSSAPVNGFTMEFGDDADGIRTLSNSPLKGENQE